MLKGKNRFAHIDPLRLYRQAFTARYSTTSSGVCIRDTHTCVRKLLDGMKTLAADILRLTRFDIVNDVG